MAIAIKSPDLVTLHEYLNEGQVEGRYEILDGIRCFMTEPLPVHQDIVLNIGAAFQRAQRDSGVGRAFVAPYDVTIVRDPLTIRQPDVCYVSKDRHKRRKDPAVDLATVSPELVVEILSPSESQRMIQSKLADYQTVGVKECWIVSPTARSIDQVLLSSDGSRSIKKYLEGEEIASAAFPFIRLRLSDLLFSEEND